MLAPNDISRIIGFTFLLVVAQPVLARADEPDGAGLALFKERIEPVLRKHCYECHSAQADEVKGNLRLDNREGMRTGGDNGPAVVPGNLEQSFLLPVIRYEEDDYQMPPDGKLPDNVIADFEKWIELGAPDPRGGEAGQQSRSAKSEHRSAEQRTPWSFQPPRSQPQPEVSDRQWPRNAVDGFLLAELESRQLQPVRDADPARLLRRVYFDLVGLPPDPDDLSGFLAEPSRDAFARRVDRLLAAPQFGERWGRHWLDVARYADSNGLDINVTYHDAWRYRNYVIDAFNKDKPYDHFVSEQIAGDLLESEDDKQRAERLVATGFLVVGPKMLSERDKEKLRMDVVDEQIDSMGRAFLGLTLGCARCHDHKFDPISARDYYALAGIFRSTTTLNGTKLNNAFVSGWLVRPLPLDAGLARALEEHQKQVAALKQEIGSLESQLKPGQSVRSTESLAGIVVDNTQAEIVGQWKDSTYQPVYVGKGYLHDDKTGKGMKSVTFTPSLPREGVYEVRISYAGGGGRSPNVPVTIRHAGGQTTLAVNQVERPPIDNLFKPLGRYRFASGAQGSVAISTGGTEGYHVIADSVQFVPAELLDDAGNLRNELAVADSGKAAKEARLKQLRDQLGALEKQAPPAAPTAMAVQEVTEPADCPIAIRGDPHRHGEMVPRGVISAAAGDSVFAIPGKSSGRRELAAWLASPDNPLTARVIVNRIWRHLMGEGLVASVDNFGNLGDRVTNPRLLDYLAIDFLRNGWSVKHTVREIVLSRAYALAADSDSPAAALDPENRCHWRGNRRPLEAEAIRDAMLVASGQLDLRRGSSPVSGLGETALDGSKSAIDYDQIQLRSVYLPVIRSDIPPMLDVFDFTDPEMVTGDRRTTTVPTQALLLLNSPFVIRQSREAARRILDQDNLDRVGRIRWFYQLALGRQPVAGEPESASQYIDACCQSMAQAGKTAAECELQAWSSFCQALFASTEFRFLE